MIPSDLKILRVDQSHDAILRNLLALYLHDMAEWFEFDSGEDGTYSYATEKFWSDRYDVYFAYAGTIPIGFGLVGPADPYIDDPGGKDFEEFFVVRRHRRSGIGRGLAAHIWDAHPGGWLIRVYQGNLPALPFWRGAIADYTDGEFGKEIRAHDGRRWSYFTFNSGG
ncbi:MAG: GNAT family N-acetyltransferase [Gammaproteobacteria bacterium]|nr:GNAT family N-acetyltransferase [Gammaproteobacteria bacterium]